MSVRVSIESAESVYTPGDGAVNLFRDSADQKLKTKDSAGLVKPVDSGGSDELPAGILAALQTSPPLAGDNVVVSVAKLTSALQPLLAITNLFKNLGTVDPTAGDGVAAASPKIGIRVYGAITEIWLKIGAGPKAWEKVHTDD